MAVTDEAVASARGRTLAVIVTWNKRDDLDRMLESLLASGPRDFAMVLVDNASTDDTVEFVSAKYPFIEVVRNAENLGGTGGFNTGVRHGLAAAAGYEFLWLLDNDVLVAPGALDELLRVMLSDARMGMAGSAILLPEPADQVQEAGARLPWGLGSPVRLGEGRLPASGGARVFEADYVAACSMLVRTEAVREVGLMDPAYFAMWDDIEWGVRFKRAGWRVAATDGSRVTHESYADRRATAALAARYLWHRNALYFFRRFAPPLARVRLIFREMRMALAKRGNFAADGRAEEAACEARLVADFLAGRMGRPPQELMRQPAREAGGGAEELRGAKRIGLITSENADLTRRLYGRLRELAPDARIDTLVFSTMPEFLSEEFSNRRVLRMDTAWHRARLCVQLPREYDTLAATVHYPRFLYERLARRSVRLGPGDEVDVRVRRWGTVAWLVLGRPVVLVRAAWLTVRALAMRMPPPDYGVMR